MDTETIERKREKDSADEWLNEIRVAANSNGRKGDAIKKHLNFDVFSIPLEKLFPETALAVNDIVNTSNEGGDAVSMEIVMGTKFTCRVCGCEFKALREQHEHFKSPLHVVNLKRSLVGLRSVSHEDDINSDEDDNMDNNTDVIGEPDASLDLMKFNQEGHLSTDNTSFKEGCAKKYNDKKNGSVITFRKHSSNWEFSISNAIFSLSSSPGSQVESTDPWITLKNTLQIFHQGEKLHSCVLILQSGMFSGGIFEGNKCISHKVFRRYTVRAKAGGGQSSFDSNGRKAKSAGATLRRYGEQALKEDIQALLTSWLPFLQSSVVILTAIPNTMKHYIFSDTLHHNGFHRDDIRIRTIPFMIKKPTFEEIKIVHQKCMLIEFSFIKEFDLALKEELTTHLEKVDEEVEEEEEVRLAATTVKAGDIVVEGSDVEEEEEEEEKEVGLSPLEVVAPEEVCCMLRDLLMDLESGGGEHFNQIMKDIELSASTAAATDSSCASSEGASQYHFKSLWLSTPHSLERLETPLHVAAEGKIVKYVSHNSHRMWRFTLLIIITVDVFIECVI